MIPDSNILERSDVSRFSDAPLGHYFIAICLTSLVETSRFAFATYECLVGSNKWGCGWTGAQLIARSQSATDARSALWSTLGVSCFFGLFLLAKFLVFNAPAYALAWYVSQRYRIRRNRIGVLIWTGAWILTFLISASFGSIIVPMPRISGELAVLGLICGIAYCALAFLDGDGVPED